MADDEHDDEPFVCEHCRTGDHSRCTDRRCRCVSVGGGRYEVVPSCPAVDR